VGDGVVTRNQRPTHPTSYGINRRNWHNDLPEPDRDDTETLGLPVPAWVEGIRHDRDKEQAK
jgi:hypothetical protein